MKCTDFREKKSLKSHTWSENKQSFRFRCVNFAIKKIKNTIVEPEHQKVLFKTRALVVLPFFSCKEAAWPSG